jgi:hypothetical protein
MEKSKIILVKEKEGIVLKITLDLESFVSKHLYHYPVIVTKLPKTFTIKFDIDDKNDIKKYINELDDYIDVSIVTEDIIRILQKRYEYLEYEMIKEG